MPDETTIKTIVPNDSRTWVKVEELLKKEGIRRDRNLEYTCGIFDNSDSLIATGSFFGNTLRCLAVDSAHRGEGLMNELLTHLMEEQADRGRFHLFVYTKTSTARFFQDLGFYEIARVEGKVSFLENRAGGFSSYLRGLQKYVRKGKSASIVMNANPFTLGHLNLIERAAGENDTVHLFLLSEDASIVPFSVRKRLVDEGIAGLDNLILHESGPYIISAATFPSYFFRDEADVIESHAMLDLTLFSSIAKVLNISSRYAGDEPTSHVTSIYNNVMARELPKQSITFVEVPRLRSSGVPISAGEVRMRIKHGSVESIRELVPDSTYRYFVSPEAESVINSIQHSDDIIHY